MTEQVQSGGDGPISVHYTDGIAFITMDRGENRMNQNFVNKFHAALDDIERHPEVKALITTGVGKFFSNGLDLNWLKSLNVDQFQLHVTDFRKLLLRLLTFPVITIAAINGHAFAGGALFSLVHDYRVMTTSRGWWCVNEIFLQMRFAPWMIKLLLMNIQSASRSDVILRGKRLIAEEAKQAGIIHATSSNENLMTSARSFAAQVLPPNEPIVRSSLANMKADMYKDIIDQARQEMMSKV